MSSDHFELGMVSAVSFGAIAFGSYDASASDLHTEAPIHGPTQHPRLR